MFGYIVANKPELKVKEFEYYQGYYCGVCKSLKERHGNIKRLTLNYDLTFIGLLLSSLDLDDPTITKERCLLHPTQKKKIIRDIYSDYACDMTILFSYFKCKDDWVDDQKKSAWVLQKALTNAYKRVKNQYANKVDIIEKYLNQLNELENNDCSNIDEISNCFGHVMEEVMCFKNDEWHPILRKIGFSLGKFIYLMDAYDDLEEDEKKNEYNVFLKYKQKENFNEWAYEILSMQMENVLDAYEELPIVENDDLLRNIICSGVWTKYQIRVQERSK